MEDRGFTGLCGGQEASLGCVEDRRLHWVVWRTGFTGLCGGQEASLGCVEDRRLHWGGDCVCVVHEYHMYMTYAGCMCGRTLSQLVHSGSACNYSATSSIREVGEYGLPKMMTMW